MKYRKKPVIIEAIKWDGTYQEMYRISREFIGAEPYSFNANPGMNTVAHWHIKTLEGEHSVSNGDYVIRGVKGEFYPCKPDIFEMTYEKCL